MCACVRVVKRVNEVHAAAVGLRMVGQAPPITGAALEIAVKALEDQVAVMQTEFPSATFAIVDSNKCRGTPIDSARSKVAVMMVSHFL